MTGKQDFMLPSVCCLFAREHAPRRGSRADPIVSFYATVTCGDCWYENRSARLRAPEWRSWTEALRLLRFGWRVKLSPATHVERGER